MSGPSGDQPALDRFAAYMKGEVFAGASSVRVADVRLPSAGSTDTMVVRLRVASSGSDEDHTVVVKQIPDQALDGADYLPQKEAAILQALKGSDVPHPPLLAFTMDRSILGRPMMVTAFVDGEGHDISRIERWPLWQQQKRDLGLELIDTLARLQGFRWQDTDLASLLGPRGSAAARMTDAIDRFIAPYDEYLNDSLPLPGAPAVVWPEIAMWLKENVADLPEDELVIGHGDYRFGNLLWVGTSVSAIVDWERATLSDPMSDLGFICMPFSRFRTWDLMFKTLPYDAVVARYEESTGRAVDHRRVQYYAIWWQFIEGGHPHRPGMLDRSTDGSARRGRINSSQILVSNTTARHTLQLIDDFERGRHVLV
jgi:aminoglycoside phosphotransferase (APT) family kinase protein